MVMHLGLGIAYPYGNSRVLPFEKRYFAGGFFWGNMTPIFNIAEARNIYKKLYAAEIQTNPAIDEVREALLFAKALYLQSIGKENIRFCDDKEFFVSKTPTGYAVSGYYEDNIGGRIPFNVTVKKNNGIWSPSASYIAADTKSITGFVWLWILLMVIAVPAHCTNVHL